MPALGDVYAPARDRGGGPCNVGAEQAGVAVAAGEEKMTSGPDRRVVCFELKGGAHRRVGPAGQRLRATNSHTAVAVAAMRLEGRPRGTFAALGRRARDNLLAGGPHFLAPEQCASTDSSLMGLKAEGKEEKGEKGSWASSFLFLFFYFMDISFPFCHTQILGVQNPDAK
jgi:hypothetical protein